MSSYTHLQPFNDNCTLSADFLLDHDMQKTRIIHFEWPTEHLTYQITVKQVISYEADMQELKNIWLV